MTVRLPNKVDGPLTVVVDRDGERVALRMVPSGYGAGWHVPRTPGGPVMGNGCARPGHDYVAGWGLAWPVLDHWPTSGVPLPDVADGPLIVCYADGAARRVALALPSEGGGDWWIVPTMSVWFVVNDSEACMGAGGSLKPSGVVLGWCRADTVDADAVAREWRVSAGDVRKALEAAPCD